MSTRTGRVSGKFTGQLLFLGSALALAAAAAADPVNLPAATPVFGITTAPDQSLLVADAGSGIMELRKGSAGPVAQLPGVTDVAAIGRGSMFAVTSVAFGGDGRLYRVSRGSTREVADLFEFESRVNPDGGIINTNPFDVAVLSGNTALVADAAANALLIVDEHGTVDWVATLPNEVVSTANVKSILGCPGSGAPPCGLPPAIPAEPVATSIAIGPDGAFYMGELKGFPAPTGESRVWRVEPWARHAVCGSSPDCRVVADGFTSIIDLAFGPDGTLYVVELDERSWFAMENGVGTGGSVNACNSTTWACTQIATGLNMVTSATVGRNGKVSIVTNALIPGAATISTLP